MWETAAQESTLTFYEKEREIYNTSVAGDSYRVMVDSEWLKGIDDTTDITVQVIVITLACTQ